MEVSVKAYRISELPMGKTQAYAQIKLGKLKARKLGSRTIVLESDLQHFLQSLPLVKTGAA